MTKTSLHKRAVPKRKTRHVSKVRKARKVLKVHKVRKVRKGAKGDSLRLFHPILIVGLGVLLLVSVMVRLAPTAAAEAQELLHVSPYIILVTPAIQIDVAAVAPMAVQAKTAETRLQIPKIKVDAIIKDVGVTAQGNMAVPDSLVDVGWYSLGTRPGEAGSAVIGGHNRWYDQAAVFNYLDQLERGDVVSVVDANGVTSSFVVQNMRTFNANDTNSGVFESSSGAHLNLITCSGVYDPSTKSYPTRLVVYTDLVGSHSAIALASDQAL